MSSHDTMNPIGGVNMEHVMESSDPNAYLWLFKELCVIVYYPTTVR